VGAGLEVDPRHVDTLNNLERMYKQHGRPEEVRLLWEWGLDVDPQDMDTLFNLGVLHCTSTASRRRLGCCESGSWR
jgi:hypothetical protein